MLFGQGKFYPSTEDEGAGDRDGGLGFQLPAVARGPSQITLRDPPLLEHDVRAILIVRGAKI